MKKNKGLLMGIAALALLFSIAFPGCESATGAAGDQGNSVELWQKFTISKDFQVVIPDGVTEYNFGAWYEGINIVPDQTIEWKVTGSGGYDDAAPDTTVNGHHPKTIFVGKTEKSAFNTLIVADGELAETLTITATYGGYTDTETVTVGVPRIVGLKLQKGSEIGTTNVTDSGYMAGRPLNTVETYLVYTIDDKEVKEVRRGDAITALGTARVNLKDLFPEVDYNIPIEQEKWLTIYEVPLPGGDSKDKHVTALKFCSLPATKVKDAIESSESNVLLPGDPNTLTTFPAFPTSSTVTVQGKDVTVIPGPLSAETQPVHGKYTTRYTAYAVYYDPSVDYGPGLKKPALNTRFIPPAGSVPINTGTDKIPLNKTGRWDIILQYTDTVKETGYGAWNYVGSVTITDSKEFVAVFEKASSGNVVHVTVEGKTFKDFGEGFGTKDLGDLFTGLGTLVHASRDSDTVVTLYLPNDVRTVLTQNKVTISSTVFNDGTPPKIAASDTTDPNDKDDFITATISDQKFTNANIGGISPLPYTFTVGTPSPNVTVGAIDGFPYGDPNTTITITDPATGVQTQTVTPGVVYTITWYYVDGSTWSPTGTTGPSFTPLPEDKGRTLGIRASVEGNSPYVTLIDVIPGVGPSPIKKWRIIDYGQRILGAVSNL
jgi:hypothetical protein